jgi:oxepin-CoA hydrolase/3-oxo-5,6-dehydrosuberyl-CoA semialdehyde dehydrogenase
MNHLQSYAYGAWAGSGGGVALRDATSGQVICEVSTRSPDFARMLIHAREVGGAELRGLSFHQRASLLRALCKRLTELKEELYTLSYCTGATRGDSWIDIEGGIGTVASFAAKAQRDLPNGIEYLDGPVEGLSKQGSFVGQHLFVSRRGVAIHINAFNFPVWGMLEKLAPAFLAGMPVIVKPATATAYLTEHVVRRILETDLLPPGTLQLICGGVGNLFDGLICQDVVSFTGSASTAAALRVHPMVLRNAVPFIAETDSLNSCILGEDGAPGSVEFELFVKEVVREMTVKAGQKCTAIRKAVVPQRHASAVLEALQAALKEIVVGDPRHAAVRMGPLASLEQRREVLKQVEALRRESELLDLDTQFVAADAEQGAFVAPMLLRVRDAAGARLVHEVEAFGPAVSVLGYRDEAQAIELACRGEGSLAASIFSADDTHARRLALGIAPYHGRVLIANARCAKESTGHGSPLAPLIHGGPGRAGGGEELGGLRGILHYMQRLAVQGAPDTLTAVGGRFVRGSLLKDPGRHPFKIPFHELRIGDTLKSAEREVTVEDIEAFAALSGDHFYAHMDEGQAARNPLFGGRVAHGYFLISAAAGLFVEPNYGPVLGNYGLNNLRFVKPVKPLDRIKVRLTCAEKSLRADKGWGEVGWDTEITNQLGETVASYSVLTMVSVHEVPDGQGG